DDMVDLMGRKRIVFMQEAILATPGRSPGYEQTQCGGNLVAHEPSYDLRRICARAFAMIIRCSRRRYSSSSSSSDGVVLASFRRSINSRTRAWAFSDGRKFAMLSAVVPAARKSRISS